MWSKDGQRGTPSTVVTAARWVRVELVSPGAIAGHRLMLDPRLRHDKLTRHQVGPALLGEGQVLAPSCAARPPTSFIVDLPTTVWPLPQPAAHAMSVERYGDTR